jgi:hypothetical protein
MSVPETWHAFKRRQRQERADFLSKISGERLSYPKAAEKYGMSVGGLHSACKSHEVQWLGAKTDEQIAKETGQ